MRVISRPCQNINIFCTGFQCIYSLDTAHLHCRASEKIKSTFKIQNLTEA